MNPEKADATTGPTQNNSTAVSVPCRDLQEVRDGTLGLAVKSTGAKMLAIPLHSARPQSGEGKLLLQLPQAVAPPG